MSDPQVVLTTVGYRIKVTGKSAVKLQRVIHKEEDGLISIKYNELGDFEDFDKAEDFLKQMLEGARFFNVNGVRISTPDWVEDQPGGQPV